MSIGGLFADILTILGRLGRVKSSPNWANHSCFDAVGSRGVNPKAALKTRALSKRFARYETLCHSRSVWSAVALAPLWAYFKIKRHLTGQFNDIWDAWDGYF